MQNAGKRLGIDAEVTSRRNFRLNAVEKTEVYFGCNTRMWYMMAHLGKMQKGVLQEG